MSILNDLEKIYRIMPTIKKITIPRDQWMQLYLELSTIQLVGSSGFDQPASYIGGLIYFKDIEIWNAEYLILTEGSEMKNEQIELPQIKVEYFATMNNLEENLIAIRFQSGEIIGTLCFSPFDAEELIIGLQIS